MLDCDICDELNGELPSWLENESRLMVEDEHFALTPTLGCLTPGYVLIWSKSHVPSMASLRTRERAALLAFLARVVKTLEAEYGAVAVFEHGADGLSQAGNCVDHAHFHLFPCSNGLGQRLGALRENWSILDWSELGSLSGLPYLLHSLPGQPNPAVSLVEEGIKSQLVRRVLAEDLGIPDQWDWALFPFLNHLRETQRRWSL
jgi:diadenosine tetraphosphate (Ap4A) HIT family hydrolase